MATNTDTGAIPGTLKSAAREFMSGASSSIASKPQPPKGWDKVGDFFLSGVTLGQASLTKDYQYDLKRWVQKSAARLGEGAQVQNQLQQRQTTLSQQALDQQADFQAQAKKQLADIEQGTIQEFERGLLGGQTVQEVAEAQRKRRLGYVNEAANQQRATLFRQNEFTQEQLQQQGRQSELAARQTTGARGIGGSSVENQIIAGQQANTASQEAQAQEQLGQGLFTVNEQTAKQSADIEADIKKTIQEQSSTMQAAFMSKQASDRTDIINQQQGKIQELQNAYVLKRTEIDELTRKVQSAINGLIA